MSYIRDYCWLRKEIDRLAKAAVEQQSCIEDNTKKIEELTRAISDQNFYDKEKSELRKRTKKLAKQGLDKTLNIMENMEM